MLLGMFVSKSSFAGLEEGASYYERGDFASALKEWQPLANHGDVHAQYNLCAMYYNGQGVKQDRSQAAAWCQKSADQGRIDAYYMLGVMYEYGQGVAQDYKQAAEWYLKAAEQDNVVAQHNLGGLYYRGDGVVQDYKQAAKWYLKAAEQGFSNSQLSIGLGYILGVGVAQDYAKGKEWLQKAAAQGNSQAQQHLKTLENESLHKSTKNSSNLPEWKSLGSTESATVYIDQSSIQQSGGNVKVWVLTDLITPVRIDGNLIRSMKNLYEMDCKSHRVRTLSFSWYLNSSGKGDATRSGTTPSPFDDIPNGNLVSKYLCSV